MVFVVSLYVLGHTSLLALCSLCHSSLGGWYCRLTLSLVRQNAASSWNSLLLLSDVVHTTVSVLQTDASPWQQLHEFIHHSPQHQRGLTHNPATPLWWTCISPWPDAEKVPAAWSISVLCLPEQLKALPLPTSPSSAPLRPSASLQSLS